MWNGNPWIIIIIIIIIIMARWEYPRDHMHAAHRLPVSIELRSPLGVHLLERAVRVLDPCDEQRIRPAPRPPLALALLLPLVVVALAE